MSAQRLAFLPKFVFILAASSLDPGFWTLIGAFASQESPQLAKEPDQPIKLNFQAVIKSAALAADLITA